MLNDAAEQLPHVFIEETETVKMTGYWLNRSGYGETQRFDETMIYDVPQPLYRAVTHRQQLKDAYKKGGEAAVMEYINKVTEQIATA